MPEPPEPEMPDVTVVVPMRNERSSVDPLFEKFDHLSGPAAPDRVLVVDGASTDGTAARAEAWRDRLPVEVLRLEENLGLGGALEVGFGRALEDGPDAVVTMDGDDSHDPAAILDLVARLREGCDVVIASRFQPGGQEVGVAGGRKLLSHAASRTFRLLFPTRSVTDYSSGFRAYRPRALHRVEREYGSLVAERGFACQMELLLRLRATGARMAEVPLVLRYDRKASESKMEIGATLLRYGAVIGRHLGQLGPMENGRVGTDGWKAW